MYRINMKIKEKLKTYSEIILFKKPSFKNFLKTTFISF